MNNNTVHNFIMYNISRNGMKQYDKCLLLIDK